MVAFMVFFMGLWIASNSVFGAAHFFDHILARFDTAKCIIERLVAGHGHFIDLGPGHLRRSSARVTPQGFDDLGALRCDLA